MSTTTVGQTTRSIGLFINSAHNWLKHAFAAAFGDAFLWGKLTFRALDKTGVGHGRSFCILGVGYQILIFNIFVAKTLSLLRKYYT